MREIKFRGKTANGEWVYGSLTYSDNIEPAIYFEFGKGTVKTFDFVYVKPETVGQFTGLHDATKWEDLTDAERDEWIKSGHTKEDWKGRRIFEGDIIEFKNIDRQYVKGIVYYLGSCFVIKSIVADEDDYNLGGVFSTAEGLIKVIGNIHDNKMEEFK